MRPSIPPAADGLTRRQVLKRGVALGAATMWTTPALQVVRMSTAQAQATSGATCVTYCMKLDVATGVWQPLEPPGTDIGVVNHNCLVCPDDAVNGLPSDKQPEGFSFSPDAGGYIVTYPLTWSLLELDSTPDEFTGTATAAARCGPGNAAMSCSYVGPDNESEIEDPNVSGNTLRALYIPPCPSANNKPITQIELIIRHCPEQ